MCAGEVFVDLVEKNLSAVGVVDGLDLIRKNLFAAAWEINVKVNIMVDDAGVG